MLVTQAKQPCQFNKERNFIMNQYQPTVAYTPARRRFRVNTDAVKKVLERVLAWGITAIIIGLIALYYIQLSHMA